MEGERFPFESEGIAVMVLGCDFFVEAVVDFCFARVLGLRLRARFSRLESESEGSLASEMASGEAPRLAVAERVMGAK